MPEKAAEIEGNRGPGRSPTHRQSAASPQGPERVGPGLLAHTVSHDVGSSSAGLPPDLRDHVGGAVVYCDIGSQLSCGVELGVRAAGDDRTGADQPGDLECGKRHPATNPPDQQRLPGSRRARVTSIRQAVRVASENAAAWAQDMAGGTGARFSAGTMTYSAAVPAQCSPRTRSLPQSECSPYGAGGAFAAGERRIDHDPVARPELSHRLTHLVHRPAPSDPRTWGKSGLPGQAGHDKEIEPVERRGLYPDAHLVWGLDVGSGNSCTLSCSSPPGATSVRALIRLGLQNDGFRICSPGLSGTANGGTSGSRRLQEEAEFDTTLGGVGDSADDVGQAVSLPGDGNGWHRVFGLEQLIGAGPYPRPGA